MDDKLFEILREITKSLSRVESKQNELCRNQKSLRTDINKLEEKVDCHTKEAMRDINDRVPWKIFVIVAGAYITVLLSAFTYTYYVDSTLDQHKLNHTTEEHHTEKKEDVSGVF